jgi:hypothetical protein
MTVAALATLQAALFFWYLTAAIIRQPFWDMFSYVLHYLEYRANGGWWAYLWAAHGGQHRPVWIRLLTAFDIEAFSGVAYPFIVTATACHLMTAWLLWRESRAAVAGDVGRVVGLIVVMVVLSSVAAVDCAVPIDNPYPQALAFAVIALVLINGPLTPGPSSAAVLWRRRIGAMAAVIGGIFANAVAMALWPILVWSAWRARAGWAWTASIAGVAVAFTWIYLTGLSLSPAASQAAEGPVSVSAIVDRASYLFTYMGLPWTRAASLLFPGQVAGAVLFTTGAAAVVWRGLLRPSDGRLERLAVALMAFSLASAIMATLGRGGDAVSGDVLVPVRYSVLLTPLHVGLLWMAAPAFARRWNSLRWGSLAAAGAVAFCLLLLAQQVAAGRAAAATTARMRATIDRFLNGENDPDMTKVIFADVDHARREMDVIRQAGLYQHLK